MPFHVILFEIKEELKEFPFEGYYDNFVPIVLRITYTCILFHIFCFVLFYLFLLMFFFSLRYSVHIDLYALLVVCVESRSR